tara:strand:+ start:119 stop:691 length:573 start_codon:yes stop_codon:yes gene_type:complete
MGFFRAIITRFRRDTRGAALIEFGLAFPILLMLFVSGVELTRFLLINQQLDKAANQVADLVTQLNSVTTGDLNNILSAMPELVTGYSDARSAQVVSIVRKNGANPPRVQDQYVGGGAIGQGSKVGAIGGIASINNFTMQPGDEALTVEVYYQYEPLLLPIIEWLELDITQGQYLYKIAIFRPRLGALNSF